jgi:hypothetical protein
MYQKKMFQECYMNRAMPVFMAACSFGFIYIHVGCWMCMLDAFGMQLEEETHDHVATYCRRQRSTTNMFQMCWWPRLWRRVMAGCIHVLVVLVVSRRNLHLLAALPGVFCTPRRQWPTAAARCKSCRHSASIPSHPTPEGDLVSLCYIPDNIGSDFWPHGGG